MAIPKEDILLSIVSSEDKDRIPLDIASKLNSILSEKWNELISSKALLQTAKDNAEQSLSDYKDKYANVDSTHDSLTERNNTLSATNAALQTQLSANVAELGTVRQRCSELENEGSKLRLERHQAADERDAAISAIARKDEELSRLKEEIKVLQEQLQKEMDNKCEARAQLGDVESRMLRLDDREKVIVQERVMFNAQLNALEKQLATKTEELLTIRRDTSGHSVILETHMARLQDEHNQLQKQHTTLHKQYTDLQKSCTNLQNEHIDEKQKMQVQLNSFQQELDAQRKLAELYRVDSEMKNGQVEELEKQLGEVKVKLDAIETSYSELARDSEEIVRKKSEFVELLRNELKSVREESENKGKLEEISDRFPLAAQMNNLMGDSSSAMSLTQIYNRFVSVSEELVEEHLETERQRGYIQKLLDELQEKGPWLQQTLKKVETLTQDQNDLQLEMEQLREKLQQCECDRLRVQLNDLGRQVCRLLQQTDSEDMTSKHLVTFSTISELQKNNQSLLATVRELTGKKEDAKHSEDLMAQIKLLREANGDLVKEQERQDKVTKMLMGQRDTYKTLLEHAKVGKSGDQIINDPQKSQLLQKSQKEVEQLTAEYETYRKEKTANEQILIDVNNRLREESQQLANTNTELTATLDTTQLRLQSAKRSVDTLRKQVVALEDRLSIHAKSQISLENALMHCKDEVYESMTKLSKSEVTLGQKEMDLAMLKDSNERLIVERDTFRNECLSLKVFDGNMVLFKATMERTDAERSAKMEAALVKERKESGELRKRLQEAEREFRDQTEQIQTKANSAKILMESERTAADKLRTDLAQMREELQLKTKQLQQSGSQVSFVDRTQELDALRQKLDLAKKALDQHSKTADQASKQLTALSEQYNIYRANTERQINEQRTKIADLELKLRNNDKVNMPPVTDDKFNKLMEIQKKDVEESKKIAEEMQEKYRVEVALHSTDLQTINSLKISLEAIKSELQKMKLAHDEWLKKEIDWKELNDRVLKEKEELKQELQDLKSQNTLLHDELQQLNSTSSNISLNRSINEDEVKDSAQLVKIIKYLRQEKDVALSKADMLSSEQTRNRLELEMCKKELSEAKKSLEEERSKSETSLTSNTQNIDLLQKLETMNAITDSNRTLRSERDEHLEKLKELYSKMEKLEKDTAPLEEQLTESTKRCESLQSENASLRGEATRWRQRANTLIEKTNRTSSEDWKKLQTERETLAKQLTIERANIVRLNDDLTNANVERSKLEESVKNLNTLTDELSTIKAELQQLKTDHTKLNADHITLGKDLSSKEAELTDLKYQLTQVRKIAKKYKLQYEETQQKTSDLSTEKITKLEEELKDCKETITQLTSKNEGSQQELEKAKELMQGSKDRFTQVLKNAKDRMAALTETKNRLETEIRDLKGAKDDKNSGETSDQLKEVKERHKGEVDELKERLSQLQRLLEGTGQSSADNKVTEVPAASLVPPTANIKPMAGHMTSLIRPMHPLHSRSTTGVPQVSVQPQQVQVHTTAASTSSVDTSSHSSTEQQQQQLPTIRVLPSVVDAVPSTSTSTTVASVVGVVSATTSTTAGTSSSSSTVTTSGVKRMRTEDQSDSTTTSVEQGSAATGKVQAQVQPLVKRPRLRDQQEQVQQIEASDDADAAAGAEADVEYQVPTSSQRDHDEDVEEQEVDCMDEDDCVQIIHLVVSEDDDNDEAEAAAAEDVAQNDDEEDSSGGRKRKRSVVDIEEEGNVQNEDGIVAEDEGDEASAVTEQVQQQQQLEVDVVDDEVQQADGGTEEENASGQMEATSSSTSATSSSSRLQQQPQLLLPEESADDSIVPSTPTLFVPRRGTSGDGVSSPHPQVPSATQGHTLFTFATDSQQQQQEEAAGSEQEVQEQSSTLDEAEAEAEQRSERSVPNATAHQTVENNGQLQQQVEGSEEAIVGETPLCSAADGGEDEGREAEASPAASTVGQQRGSAPGSSSGAASGSGLTVSTGIPRAIPTLGAGMRRTTTTTTMARPVSSSSGQGVAATPTPIVWNQQQRQQQQQQQQQMLLQRSSPRHAEMMRGRGAASAQRARRSRGAMPPRGGYSRF